MPSPRVSLTSFLSTAKSLLNNSISKASPLIFVIGNESADLDSLCSAVVLAYLRTYTSTTKPSTFYVPLSNLSHNDLSLRPELTAALAHANLTPSDLVTLSDLPPISKRASHLRVEHARWLLVDHNVLQDGMKDIYGSRVVGCIDHHDDEHKVPDACGEEPRVIRKSGSCSSLVVEYCREAWQTLSSEAQASQAAVWDSQIAYLALAPILIDTSNLTNNFVTSTDQDAAKHMESLIQKENESFNKEQYFKELCAVKEHIGPLSLPDILRKDYKQWTETGGIKLGASSVVKNMEFLLEKAGNKEAFYESLKVFSNERDLSVVSIMTTSHVDGQFQRELFLWALNDKGVRAVKSFERDSAKELGLETWKKGNLDSDQPGLLRRCWHQRSVDKSRKQVGPLLRNATSKSSLGHL
ncbi:hypothetical protein BJ878DRAFT_543627 [Calycina marina]|uniref:DHHA2 domain-containing protein n=1 Tax=Calycina marina TaxID=1763456 RepID=A0A9P8CDJ3_9HELO|nr:hypothetical protein BJ878DRAFT_543627 [Calycina marina]